MFDSEDNPNKTKPSDLDLVKLDDLEVDGVMHCESGAWSVMRYPKYYCLVFNTKVHKFAMVDMETKEAVLAFLEAMEK